MSSAVHTWSSTPHLLSALLMVSGLSFAEKAEAAGFEGAAAGARDVGRGGASVVGADSAMAMFHNPAALLSPGSTLDTVLALNTHFTSLCFTRRIVKESADGARSGGETLPEVCSQKGATLLPETAIALRLGKTPRFAVALGTYVPPAISRDFRYGDSDTGQFTPSGGTATEATPSRYAMMREQILQLFPTLSFAIEAHPQLRFGAGFGAGITTFELTNVSFSRVSINPSFQAGATSDVRAHVKGADMFVPRVNAGLWAKPARNLPLELGASFSWTADVRTKGATLDIRGLHTDYYGSPLISGILSTTPQPDIHAQVEGVTALSPQTATLMTGARYVHALPKPVDRAGDRLSRERFDVELNLGLAFTDRVDAFALEVPATNVIVPSPSALSPDIVLPLPSRIDQPHGWRNQALARIGGDYSVLPGRVAVRAGASYESAGVKPGYEQPDFLPVRRVGLSLGATVRIVAYVDASLAYAHLFAQTRRVGIRDAQVRRSVAGATVPGDDELINAGTFTQHTDVLVAEISARF